MNYVYRVISFLVLIVLFIGCGSHDNNNENKSQTNSKEYSSSGACFVETRSIFKNINAPVFTSSSSVDIYEGKKNVSTITATPNNGGTISYLICGRGSESFDIGSSNGKITFKNAITSDYDTRSSYKIIVKATDSNDNKSTSQIFTINIKEGIAPKIENITERKTFALNKVITPIEFSNTGGAIVSCIVTPSLPNGLNVALSATDSCVLSGTPTVSKSSTEYTITAKNTNGEDGATINITTLQLAPIISDTMLSTRFPTQSMGTTHILDMQSENWKFKNTGGTIASCEINSTLPSGLNFNTTTCEITGTPTIQVLDSYTITASDSDGQKSNDLIISIHVKKKDLNINNISGNSALVVDEAMTPIQFGPDEILYCVISSPLPSGLTLLANKTDKTCKITGTPTNTKVSTEYTVTAMNTISGGSATVTIVVNPPAPNIANEADKTFTSGTAISSFNFTNTGGTITSCTIDTPLSTGLSFNTTTCEITGTPTGGAVAQKTYTITATNAAGDNSATVKITVNEALPNISDTILSTIFPTESVGSSYILDFPSEPWKFNNTGGAITSCEINPALPSGLMLGNDCTITGTPTTQVLGGFTIQGSNSENVKGNALSISIHVKRKDLSISNILGNPDLVVGEAMTPIQFDNILYCAISPELPLGLTLLANKTNKTCKITGTPTEAKTSTEYTITAMNATSGGSATVTIVVK